MADYRPLHEVIVEQLAHLCELYATEAALAKPDGMTDKMVGLGAEIEALCAVLDNGVISSKHLPEVLARLRKAQIDHLDVVGTMINSVHVRFNMLILNLNSRGESTDGLLPLHEVLLGWLEHQVRSFQTAATIPREDLMFVHGAEIQVCCHALQYGVVPDAEIRGATAWLGRLVAFLPRGENPTLQAVAAAMRVAHADLEDRRLPSPALGEVAPDAS